MEAPSKNSIRKYVSAIKKAKQKHLTVEMLSRIVGVYPEIIAEGISFFEPMIILNSDLNVRDVLPQMESYIDTLPTNNESTPKRIVITKKEVHGYDSVQDFLYSKMTNAGLIDKNAILSEADLKLLRKIVNEQIANLKTKKKKHK
jgi:hypothetical protein